MAGRVPEAMAMTRPFVLLIVALLVAAPAATAQTPVPPGPSGPLGLFGSGPRPDLIFRRSIGFRMFSPDDKLATYGLDDPDVEGVACHFTVTEKGGWSGWMGLAEQLSEVSLACRQIGPIQFRSRTNQGDVVFREGRSFFFKRMQIVRGCDARRNVLVYMIYSDRLIDGSPQNSTSTVPIMPWGGSEVARCAEWIRA